MHADNSQTGHNRTIRITGIPDRHMPELTITINYVCQDGARVDCAVALDNIVIPTIIQGLNTVSPVDKRLAS